MNCSPSLEYVETIFALIACQCIKSILDVVTKIKKQNKQKHEGKVRIRRKLRSLLYKQLP